jgi:hypothetical protein
LLYCWESRDFSVRGIPASLNHESCMGYFRRGFKSRQKQVKPFFPAEAC